MHIKLSKLILMNDKDNGIYVKHDYVAAQNIYTNLVSFVFSHLLSLFAPFFTFLESEEFWWQESRKVALGVKVKREVFSKEKGGTFKPLKSFLYEGQ